MTTETAGRHADPSRSPPGEWFAGHLRDAEAVLPRWLLRNGVHQFHLVAHLRAERLLDECAIFRRLSSPNRSSGTRRMRSSRERFLHDLHLGGAGDEQGEVLGQRDARDEPAGRREDVVGLAALDALDQRQPAAARAQPAPTARPRRRSGSGSAAWRVGRSVTTSEPGLPGGAGCRLDSRVARCPR